MTKILVTEIEIGASQEKVWEILTDFPSYPSWNPFIKSIAGEPVAGTRLDVTIQPPGGRGITLHPKVLSAIPGTELKWLGHALGVPGIFDGEHHLLIHSTAPGSVRFVQQEIFGGVLVPLTNKLLGRTREGFEGMNRALKQRAEDSGSQSLHGELRNPGG
jgi:hypothetical protein